MAPSAPGSRRARSRGTRRGLQPAVPGAPGAQPCLTRERGAMRRGGAGSAVTACAPLVRLALPWVPSHLVPLSCRRHRPPWPRECLRRASLPVLCVQSFSSSRVPPPSPPHWAPSSLPWAGQKVPRGLFLPIYVPSSSRNWGILTDNRARDMEVAGGATAGRTCSPTPGDVQGRQASSLQGPAKVTCQGHGRSVWGTGVRPGQCDPTQRSSGGRVGPELPGARPSWSQAVHRPEPCPPPPGLPDTDLRCFPETRPSTQPDGPTEAVMGRPPVGAAPGS